MASALDTQVVPQELPAVAAPPLAGATDFFESLSREDHQTSNDVFQVVDAINLPNVQLESGLRPISSGFADIYKFPTSTGLELPPQTRFVALKCIRSPRTRPHGYEHESIACARKWVEDEIRIWKRTKHAYVLRFLGVFHWTEKEVPCLVSPWMSLGTSGNYLKSDPQADVLGFIVKAAEGFSYIHSIDIYHGDIRGDNILVNHAREPQICDFGCSKLLGSDGNILWDEQGSRSGILNLKSYPGNVRWMDPQLLQVSPNSGRTNYLAADVWSFARTVLELWSGDLPFLNIFDTKKVAEHVRNGILPIFPSCYLLKLKVLNPSVEDICLKCWSSKPSERPSMVAVAQSLRDLIPSPITGMGIVSPHIPLEHAICSSTASSSRNSSTSTVRPVNALSDRRQIPQILVPPPKPFILGESESISGSSVNPASSASRTTTRTTSTVISGDSAKGYPRRLEDFVRKQGWKMNYVENSEGAAHVRTWSVTCVVNGNELGVGKATNKKEAKIDAARQALDFLIDPENMDASGARNELHRYILENGLFNDSVQKFTHQGPPHNRVWKFELTLRGVYCGASIAGSKDDAMDKLAESVMPILSAIDMTFLLKLVDNDLFERRKFILIDRLRALHESVDESVRVPSLL